MLYELINQRISKCLVILFPLYMYNITHRISEFLTLLDHMHLNKLDLTECHAKSSELKPGAGEWDGRR